MENLIEWFNGLGDQKFVIGFFAVVVIIYIPFLFNYKKKLKNNTANWCSANPDAAKIYFQSKSNVVKNNNLTVTGLPEAEHVNFSEGMKYGIYLKPGTHVLNATFTTTRPGVMYRSVTKTYGPTKVEVEVKSEGIYNFYFDQKQEQYVLEEIDK